jgi:hypothetical protein
LWVSESEIRRGAGSQSQGCAITGLVFICIDYTVSTIGNVSCDLGAGCIADGTVRLAVDAGFCGGIAIIAILACRSIYSVVTTVRGDSLHLVTGRITDSAASQAILAGLGGRVAIIAVLASLETAVSTIRWIRGGRGAGVHWIIYWAGQEEHCSYQAQGG